MSFTNLMSCINYIWSVNTIFMIQKTSYSQVSDAETFPLLEILPNLHQFSEDMQSSLKRFARISQS